MEKLEGYKVLSLMRQRPEWRDIPVLVFSEENRRTPEPSHRGNERNIE
jgi:CheY-like chemotaxis protein